MTFEENLETVRKALSVWGLDTLEMGDYEGPDGDVAEAALDAILSEYNSLREALERRSGPEMRAIARKALGDR